MIIHEAVFRTQDIIVLSLLHHITQKYNIALDFLKSRTIYVCEFHLMQIVRSAVLKITDYSVIAVLNVKTGAFLFGM